MNPTNANTLIGMLLNWLPLILLIGVWVFFMRQMQGRGGLYGYQKRGVEALERIATALERRN